MFSIKSLTKRYKAKDEDEIISHLDLELKENEFVTLFGPNGSGKTSLLNILSGLDPCYEGSVSYDGRCIKDLNVGMVFQNYNDSLFPWMTVYENLIFGLKKEKKVCDDTALKLLAIVGLDMQKDNYIYELSGGQRQLVSICRAIARDPDVFLLDEPFSALDYSTTRKMEVELLKIWEAKKTTTLFVSHDIDEAIFLADRVVVVSRKPMIIKKVIDINLPRPRTLAMLSSQEFNDIRTKILEIFDYE